MTIPVSLLGRTLGFLTTDQKLTWTVSWTPDQEHALESVAKSVSLGQSG